MRDLWEISYMLETEEVAVLLAFYSFSDTRALLPHPHMNHSNLRVSPRRVSWYCKRTPTATHTASTRALSEMSTLLHASLAMTRSTTVRRHVHPHSGAIT